MATAFSLGDCKEYVLVDEYCVLVSLFDFVLSNLRKLSGSVFERRKTCILLKELKMQSITLIGNLRE
jgi:hypothetical protein